MSTKTDRELREINDRITPLFERAEAGDCPSGAEIMEIIGDLTGDDLNRLAQMNCRAADKHKRTVTICNAVIGALSRKVSERTLVRRINRKLAKQNEVLRKWRSGGFESGSSYSAGDFYRLDFSRNVTIDFNVDIERLGKDLGVI